ncbi:MAG: rRNA pseudouridine synthase [Halobacteriovoraceae bacterium]|nr:rRNA pseudouridine synthase [Halobacteriovoraceae bacterium]
MKKEIRLQKYIADCGITSRRKAEELITRGLVKVNEKVVTQLGTKVIPGSDLVQVEDKVIDRDGLQRVYLVMNKPRGVVSTVFDPEGRKTVLDLCKGIKSRIYPVGRLDYLSEGLLLMTNDGELTQKLIHPKYEITKVYEVKVFGVVTEGLLRRLRTGVKDKGDLLVPESVRIIGQLPAKTWLEFRLKEGKNREIRRICEACGLTIDKLRRVAIGGLALDGIKPGDFNIVSRNELLRAIGLNSNGEKVKDHNYISTKKSINKKKRLKNLNTEAAQADAQEFKIFRKDKYFETMLKRKREQAEREQAEKDQLS